jgi:Ran GTPase-activating protein (RanGAP) involved in mRNA processing and transport
MCYKVVVLRSYKALVLCARGLLTLRFLSHVPHANPYVLQIDLSQRGLVPSDARLVKMALLQNANMSVLKLGYNNLGDKGAEILASGISKHRALESIDLGFNNIGNEGCKALAQAIPRDGTLHTFYLAGNLIGEDGALSIADVIRKGSSLRRLYLTGNRLGGAGVMAITEAIHEDGERRRSELAENENAASEERAMHGNGFLEDPGSGVQTGMQELFLGGTGMGPTRCRAFSRLLAHTTCLRVLSLPNCDIGDDDMAQISSSIKENREKLVLESLQLSFNNITCKGLECLTNAIWGSRTLKELLLDNNEIGDRGAQQVAAVMPFVKTLETLDVGFNVIKSTGMKLLMKAVIETHSLKSLSVAGNAIDTSTAKAVAFAMSCNRSLSSLSLVHCNIGSEGIRHISAGIVSNSQIRLRELTGFHIGPVIVTLGFPAPLEHWANDQILKFIHLMWESRNEDNPNSEEEKSMDPLHCLAGDGGHGPSNTPPLHATIVVEVAKKAFAALMEQGVDIFSRRSGHSTSSPIAGDAIIVESPEQGSKKNSESSLIEPIGNTQARSFVARPEAPKKSLPPDPSRKKRIVEWLCSNIEHLNKLSKQPFNSSELSRLHQHYFTPVVNESGGSLAPSPNQSPNPSTNVLTFSSVPCVSRTIASSHRRSQSRNPAADSSDAPGSDPSTKACVAPIGSSLPNIKRKVSYRFLNDAMISSTMLSAEPPAPAEPRRTILPMTSVSMILEGGPAYHSMPPTTKRARRNRTRISFVPRVKDKLDSYLDVCHEKALSMMRQLFYVEQAILSGKVNRVDPTTTPRTHLTGDCATDAEMILVDMI